jgi:hypothetical protein
MKGKNNKVLIPVKGKSALYCLGREYIEKEVKQDFMKAIL